MFCSFLAVFVILILLGFLSIYFKLILPQKRFYDTFYAQGVKGEPFVPLIGQIFELVKYRNNDALLSFHEKLSSKHGYLFLFGFGPLTRLICMEPDFLADVLSRNNASNYARSADGDVLKLLMGRHSLLLIEGNEHERARRMINPAFYHVNLKSMVSIITDRTAKAMESILLNDQTCQSVDLQVLFNALTLSIIASSAFGTDLVNNEDAKGIICRTLAEVLDTIEYRSMRMINQISFLSRLPFWRKDLLETGVRRMNEFISQIVRDRRQGKSKSMCNGADLLDLLLSAVDEQGKAFTDEEIQDESFTFVVAGSETTGNLMVWMLYLLMIHPTVLEVCREEVDRILPNGIEPTIEHLSELVICEAIISETLRLYPPAPLFARQCIREHTIGTNNPLRIPKGAVIVIDSYILHRRSDLWPRALEFDYTRWMRDPKTGLKPKLPHPFAYLPFAAGPRSCIGQNFALLEAKIMLAMLIQRWNFELVPGQKIVADIKVTMRTKYGLWTKISKRHL